MAKDHIYLPAMLAIIGHYKLLAGMPQIIHSVWSHAMLCEKMQELGKKWSNFGS